MAEETHSRNNPAFGLCPLLKRQRPALSLPPKHDSKLALDLSEEQTILRLSRPQLTEPLTKKTKKLKKKKKQLGLIYKQNSNM